MTQIFTAPDGSQHELPDELTPAQIESWAKENFGPPKRMDGFWGLEEDRKPDNPAEAIFHAPRDTLNAVGNAATRGAMRIPGVPAEVLNLARDAGEWAAGTPWAKTTKIQDTDLAPFSMNSIDAAFSSDGGMGLYSKNDPADWRRYPAKAAEFAAGAGATGGLKTAGGLLSSLGAGVGNQAGQDIAPNSPATQIVTTLMGLLAGGKVGRATMPAPKASSLPTVPMMEKVIQDDLANPSPMPSPQAADYFDRTSKLKRLDKIETTIDPVVARTMLDKLMAKATTVEKAHMHDATAPGLMNTIMNKTGSVASHGIGHKLGGPVGGMAGGALWKLLGAGKSLPPDPLAKISKLRDVIRTQKPFPKKPGVKQNLRGLMALLGEDEE